MINEVCGGAEAAKPKNIGGKLQCLEAPVKTFALARETFSFPDVATSKTEAAWRTAIENKDIVIFPYVEAITANNTEAVIKNARYRDYVLKEGVSGSTYRMDLAICTHEAVKSYETSEYTRIFRISANDEFTADVQSSGAVKGEAISNFNVGPRNEATDDDVPYTEIGIKYRKDTHDILVAGFDLSELEGVFEADFQIVSATSELIRFKAFAGCSGSQITSFLSADLQLLDETGAVASSTFVVPDAQGIYEFTGTGFASGYSITTDGVIDKLELFYENTEPVIITI